MGLGELPIIKDQMLSIAPHEWLQPFENDYRPLKEEYLGLELDKKPLTKAQTEALASVRARWLRGWDSNLDLLVQSQSCYLYTTPQHQYFLNFSKFIILSTSSLRDICTE